MSKYKEIELRSEEVQEILTRIPNWIIRWGSIIVSGVIFLFFFTTWFIKYPDIISAPITITTKSPAEKIQPRISGKIETVLVKDKSIVLEGTPLAIIRNAANYKDILLLKKILKIEDSRNNFDFNQFSAAQLGDVESAYTRFHSAYILKSALGNNLKRPKITDEISVENNKTQAFYQLKKAVEDWELTYVLKSSIKGQVSFLQIWTPNQTINAGDDIFAVISKGEDGYVGRLKAPAFNSGKMHLGQDVNIKLANFPDSEYGMLNGKIKNISLAADKDGNLWVEVSLPKKMETSYKKKIPFQHEMQGSAEIITEDLRLIERLFYQFRNIFGR